jgi:hypothetical protein
MSTERAELEAADAELLAARGAARDLAHHQRVLLGYQKQQERLEASIPALAAKAAKEEKEAERSQQRGPLTLIYRLLGTIEQRQQKEAAEAVMAALKLDEALSERTLLAARIMEVEATLPVLRAGAAKLESARARKEQWLLAHDSEAARTLAELGDQRAEVVAEHRQIDEAERARKNAHAVVARLAKSLEDAEGWCVADLVVQGAAGMLMSAQKHECMDEARQQIPGVMTALQRLQSECADVDVRFEVPGLSLSDRGRFADVYFDNLISDWGSVAALEKIGKQVKQLQQAIDKVLRALATKRGDLDAELETLVRSRLELIETL